MSDSEFIDNSGVKAEYERALAAAQKFHPVRKMYVNSYTGEVCQYKTPDNYTPDEGVVNNEPDLCHTEDYVSISQMYERLKRMKALSIQDAEFALDESQVSVDDLEDETMSDAADIVDDISDYENNVIPIYNAKYGRSKSSEQDASDSGAEKKAIERKNDEEASLGADEE